MFLYIFTRKFAELFAVKMYLIKSEIQQNTILQRTFQYLNIYTSIFMQKWRKTEHNFIIYSEIIFGKQLVTITGKI